jgi:hypothetical protein
VSLVDLHLFSYVMSFPAMYTECSVVVVMKCALVARCGNEDSYKCWTRGLAILHRMNGNVLYWTDNDCMFLASCGAKAYRMIKSVLAPTKPSEALFEAIVVQVGKHCNPAPAQQ